MLKQTLWGMAIAGLVLSLAAPAECKPVNALLIGNEINVKVDKDKDGDLDGFDWAKMTKAEKLANATLISTFFYAKYKAYKKGVLDLSVKADKKVVDTQAAKIVKALDKNYMFPYTRKTPLFDPALNAFTENGKKYTE